MTKAAIMPKKQKRKKRKEPGLIVAFDNKDYSPEETAFLWSRLIETLLKLEKEAQEN